MRRNRRFAEHIPAVIAIVVIAAGGIGALAIPQSSKWQTIAVGIAWITPVAIACHQYAMRRVPVWQLVVARSRHWVLNSECEWGMRFELAIEGDDAASAITTTKAAIERAYGSSLTTLSQAIDAAVWQANGVTFRLRLSKSTESLDTEQTVLLFETPSINRGYRDLRKSIDNDIFPLLGQLDSQLNPAWRKIVVSIHFSSSNPYFQMYATKAADSVVDRMDVQWFETMAGVREVVRVTDDKVAIITETVSNAKQLSDKYLSFAGS